MNQMPTLRRRPSVDFSRQLGEACEWLQIERGRAYRYLRLLQEFDAVNSLSDEHLLAYYESYEILELFQYWAKRVDEFPGLKDKIRKCCTQGPVLRDNESISSNRPRNDAFGFILAGRFSAIGISVESVDGVSSRRVGRATMVDFSFKWKENCFNVECKRIQSNRQLLKRAKEARQQLSRVAGTGIIAIDCSILYRPKHTVLETTSYSHAESEMSKWLEASIAPSICPSLSPEILGFILFSRVPAMTSTGIVDSRGESYRRRDCISSWLAVGNRAHEDPSLLQHIASMLRREAMDVSYDVSAGGPARCIGRPCANS